jgi:aminomethyltransferase
MPYPLLLHARHRDDGVLYQPFGPWVVPWRFDGFLPEYHALRTGAGLVDVSHFAFLEVRGRDRLGWLHRLLSNDIQRLTPGRGCRAALLAPNGKLIAELLVLADEDAAWLMAEASRAAALQEALARYVFTEDVVLTAHERGRAVFAVQGPGAAEVLTQVLGRVTTLSSEEDHAALALDDIPVRLIRHRLAAAFGLLCIVEAARAPEAWHRLRTRGRASGLALAGWEALNAARLEAGRPWDGLDLDESTLLPETGLEAVLASETKGCYVGQEVVARMQTYGSPSRRLVGLVGEGRDAPQAGDRLVRGGEDVGRVTSGAFSPARDRGIGFGYVKRGAYEAGTKVEILQGNRRWSASVAPRPVVPAS